MAAIVAHESRGEKAQFAKQPAYDGQLEQYAKHHVHHKHCVHVRLKRNHICHFATHLISAKKPQCAREMRK